MARKFKVGDKVKVVKKANDEPFESGFRIGTKGEVNFYMPDEQFPYLVVARNKECVFKASELELIEQGD